MRSRKGCLVGCRSRRRRVLSGISNIIGCRSDAFRRACDRVGLYLFSLAHIQKKVSHDSDQKQADNESNDAAHTAATTFLDHGLTICCRGSLDRAISSFDCAFSRHCKSPL
jgi:hypothetical protein